MKKLGWRLTICLLILTLLPFGSLAWAVGEGEATETNMALYHPVTVSSGEESATYGNDGINENTSYTYWEPAGDDVTPWWQVDLENPYPISRVELEVQKGSESQCRNFEVRASNDEDFADYTVLAVQENARPENGVFSMKSASGKSFRYLRVIKTEKNEAFTIGEFRAWVEKDKIRYGTEIHSGNTQIPAWEGSGTYVIPEDVRETPLESTVQLLGVLNLMRGYPDGNFLPEEAITRAEFVTTAIRVLGLEAGTFTDQQSYIDVEPAHWAYAYIETATQLGLVSGMGNGMFEPDSRITTAQAVRVMVTLLGYDALAREMGAYPNGYMTQAARLELLEKITSSVHENITRGEIAYLIYAALHTEVMNTSLGIVPVLSIQDYTLMNATLGIYKSSGRVTATPFTGLTHPEDNTPAGYIKINDVRMECEMPNMADYIGIPVDYYYRNDAEPLVVLMTPQKKVEIISLTEEDDPYFKDETTIVYNIDSGYDTEEAELADTVNVIYNGKALRSWDYTTLIPAAGELKLADINGDGVIELISIQALEVHIVKYVNDAKDTIYFRDTNQPLTFDSKNDSVEIMLAATGEAMTLSDLAEWDVISYSASQNLSGDRIYRIYVSREMIYGTLSQISADGVVLKNKTYQLAGSISLSDLTPGMSGSFYLDSLGRIAAYNGRDTEGVYGYLMDMMETTGLDSAIVLKVFTEKGEFAELTCSEDMTVDGLTFASASDLENHFTTYGRISGQMHQVIKYKVSSNDVITYIDTVYQNTLTENEDNLTLDAEAGYSRNFIGGVFDCDFTFDPMAVVFRVPDDMSREKDFELLSTGRFTENSAHTLSGYDGGVSRRMKLLLMSGSGADTISNQSELLVVNKIVTAIDENQEARQRLDAFYNGQEVSFFEYDEGYFASCGIQQGDICQVALSPKNEVKNLRILFDKDKAGADAGDYTVSEADPEYYRTTVSENVMTNNCYMGYGRVTAREGNVITVRYVTGTPSAYIREGVTLDLGTLGSKIYLYDSTAEREQDRVRLATAADVEDVTTVGEADASMVFFYIASVKTKAVIIIK